MRRENPTLLFSEYDLHATLEKQVSEVKAQVDKVTTDRLLNADLKELEDVLTAELKISRLCLLENDITVEQKEAKVDVSQEFNRAIFDRSKPFYIDGIRVIYYVPFTGDATLFKCKPSQFSFNPPHALIENSELIFEYDRADRAVEATKTTFDNDLRNVNQWVGWVNSQVESFNNQLLARLREELTNRRQRISDSERQVYTLGYKVRPKKETSQSESPLTQAEGKQRLGTRKKAKSPTLTYDVALSFAGEDRDYVEQVAMALKASSVKVFYDKFEQADLWGRNLIDHLADIYAKRARFIVIFVSRHYAAKAWTNHERKHAQAGALQRQEDSILPARFDDTEVPGLASSIGYINLQTTTPMQLAEMIKRKLRG
jgi:hypothetical protein